MVVMTPVTLTGLSASNRPVNYPDCQPAMARERVIHGGQDADHSGRGKRSGSGRFDDGRDSAGVFNPNDQRHDDELRPRRLVDVIGQKKVVERLQIMLDACRIRQEPMGHLLLNGPPGIGKTTLATVVPKELETDFQITSGPVLSAPKDLLPYLTNASARSVLFIDEIHRLPPAVEEFIYPAMEDFRIDITLGDGLNARTINMQLQPFTLIGATTRSGMLTAPLRDRFVNRLYLDYYDQDELSEIVNRNARKLKTQIAKEGAAEIARRSRGTPRKANNLLRWARDYADAKANGNITNSVALRSLGMIEVDELGLEEQDRKYLQTLITVFSGGPAGIQAVAHSMNVPADTLEDEVEPFLLRCGFIQRTPRGRMVTNTAIEHLGLNLSEDDDEPAQGRLFD